MVSYLRPFCLWYTQYKRLAAKPGISFVDTRHWNIELTFDGVHITEQGHHTFANHLIEYL